MHWENDVNDTKPRKKLTSDRRDFRDGKCFTKFFSRETGKLTFHSQTDDFDYSELSLKFLVILMLTLRLKLWVKRIYNI